MSSKVVSQRTQDRIKKSVGRTLAYSNNPGDDSYYFYDEETGQIHYTIYDDAFPGHSEIVAEYEIITVVIPKQATYNTEVRHG